MKTIKVVNPDNLEKFYADDINLIVNAFAKQDILVTKEQAQHMWELYSESMCAGWLGVPDKDEDIIFCLRHYYEIQA